MKVCFISVDIEHDFGTSEKKTFQGIEGVERLFRIFERSKIAATLFVTGDVLEKFLEKVRGWAERYEIASHSYSHRYFNELSYAKKGEDIRKFVDLYKKIFGKSPKGFRAPSHVIDEETFTILERHSFVYDSSIVPHYPYFKKYRGYQGEAPTTPYIPESNNIRRPDQAGGEGRIIELPVSGQLLGVPLAGAWIRKLPVRLYKTLFLLHQPSYITLSMHSWDILDERFIPKLEKILKILKDNSYVFKSGEQIAMERFAG